MSHTDKLKRSQWHKDNREFIFDYFNEVCQICNLKIGQFEMWDIHHLHYHYKNRLYDTPALELIENKVIILVCRKCHDIIHTAVDPNNPESLNNKFPCEICGKIERGIFTRKRSLNLDKLVCSDCYQLWQGIGPASLEICEKCGQKELGLTARKQSLQLDKLLCSACFKQERLDSIARYETCEVCGKLERGLTGRKEKRLLDKLLCKHCFENYRNEVID